MNFEKKLALPLIAFALVILGGGSLSAGELKGRVVAPKGSGPAVVFLRGVTGAEVPKKDVVIRHAAGGSLEPSVVIGFVGSDFVFRNDDDKLHTTHLYLHLAYQEERSGRPMKNGATLYNIALPIKGMEVRRPIKAYYEYSDSTGIIDIRCNPHPEESAAALVFDHPFAALTDAGGAFSIANVPAGEQEVWVWHGGEARKWQSVNVKASAPTEINIEVDGP